MSFLIWIVTVAAVYGQTNPESFFVKHIVFDAEYTPRFLWAIANGIIPWQGDTTDDDVACLKRELMKTGLFKRIGARLNKLGESEGYDLILTIEYKSTEPVYKLRKLEVSGVNGVDNAKFSNLIASEHLVETTVSLKTADYALFADRIFELLKKSIPDETKREWSKPPWIQIRLNGDRELEVTVLPDFTGCSDAAKENRRQSR
jgi:hypothetical protein